MDLASEIKNRVSAKEVLPFYGVELNHSGFACCPFHGEKTASLKAYDGDGGFYCFGCHAHGSVIDFVMQMFGLPFKDAIEKINDDFRLGLPVGQKISRQQKLENARNAFIARRQREQQRASQAFYSKKVEAAFDEWRAMDMQIISAEGINSIGEFTPEIIKALKEIATASYNLDCAEIERLQHERNN